MELKNADRPGWAQMTTGLPMDRRPDPRLPQDFWSALLEPSRENPTVATDLISFLKVLLDGRIRRGIRFPQRWMLLVAILAILSNQGSLMGMERFAKRHRKTLNEFLGTHIIKSPSDSTFHLPLAQLDVEGFAGLLRNWITAQFRHAEPIDSLLCAGKTLRGSIAENASSAEHFITQMSLCANTLGVAIAQSTYASKGLLELLGWREPSVQSRKFMHHLRLGPCLQMPYSARAPGETPIKGSTVYLQDGTPVGD